MADFRPADHAMGLELQLEELQEQRRRAVVQGRRQDAERLDAEIADLIAELALTSEIAASEPPEPDPGPELHDGPKLVI